ncbi:MAG: filamentous hemagglutinin N-terminal domain-containing protein [Candidatus Eremiobacteraeota bacterium]|nr:filamentous hemagglutinin N-terminal domain-containing protein [Candidatus Eremiobacteraeota bacterium]MCW5866875.1 filamentous hemagglutinin N-terminal domain-containing protein [Candidatus Eremiobacteraeota bacterium]
MHRTILAYVIGLGLSAGGWALPTDPTTVHGQVQIQSLNPNFLQILQSSPQAILNWNQFNIGLGETVRFLQPGTQAAILNRVTGVDPSLIQGTLQANGRVFLLNPNGILFGPNSIVDVGSFTASTLKMSDDDFLSGTYRLTQDRSLPLAAITNQGEIRVADGGFVVLVSPLLDNQGLIVAQTGHVNLGATTQATFSVDGRGQIQFAVPDGFNPQFTGGGQGGTVLLQPGQMSQILGQVVNNPGLIEAGSFESQGNGQTLAHGAEGLLLNSGTIRADGGTVRLDSSQATVHTGSGLVSANNGGDARLLSDGTTLSLGAVNATNGFAEISGHRLYLQGPVNVGNGTLLLDPDNIDIVDGPPNSGTYDMMLGSLPSNGDGTVSTGAIIAATNLVLMANNDINYAGNGFTGLSTHLTLNAGNDINLTHDGTIEVAELILRAGQDITVNTPGSIRMLARDGALDFSAQNGDLLIQANGNGNIEFQATDAITLDAGRDLTVRTGNPFTFSETATLTSLTAGRDITVQVTNWNQPGMASVVHMEAGNDVNLQAFPAGSTQMNVGGLNVSAGRDILSSHDNAHSITSLGDLELKATRNLTMNESSLGLTSQTGRTLLSGREVSLNTSGGNLRVEGRTAVNVISTNGNITAQAGGTNVFLATNGDTTLRSSGGNITDSAANNLQIGSTGATLVTSTNDIALQSGPANSIQFDGTSINLQAGNDLSLHTPGISEGVLGPLSMTAGRDVLLSSPGGFGVSPIPSLSIAATRDLLVDTNIGGNFFITTNGDQTLSAGRNLRVDVEGGAAYQANGGKITWTAGGLNSTTGSTQSFNSAGAVNITTTNSSEDLVLRATGGDVVLQASDSNGSVNLTSERDIQLTAPSNMAIQGGLTAGTVGINATRDLLLETGGGQTITLRGPSQSLRAGHNLVLSGTNFIGNSGPASVLSLTAGNDLRVESKPLTGLRFEFDQVDASATHDLVVTGAAGSTLTARTGDLRLAAGNNLTLTNGAGSVISAGGAIDFQGKNVTLTTSAGSLDSNGVTGNRITATAGNVNLRADGANSVLQVRSTNGSVQVTASDNVTAAADSNLLFSSATSATTTLSAGLDLTTTTTAGHNLHLNGGPSLLTAGRNVTLTQDRIENGDVNIQTTTGNVLIQAPAGQNNLINTSSLNISSGGDLIGISPGSLSWGTSTGNNTLKANGSVNIAASGGDLRLRGGDRLTVQGQSVTTRATGGTLLDAPGAIVVNATTGDVDLRTSGFSLEVASSGGPTTIRAARDVLLDQPNNLVLRSNSQLTVNATRDASFSTGPGSQFTVDSTNTLLNAGRQVSYTGDSLAATGRLNLSTLDSGGNISLQSLPGRSLNVSTLGLNITSSNDLAFTSANQLNVSSASGRDLSLTADGNVTMTAPGAINVAATGENVIIAGRDVQIQAGASSLISAADELILWAGSIAPEGDLTVTTTAGSLQLTGGTGPTNLQSGRDIRVETPADLTLGGSGGVRITSGRDLDLTTGSSQALTLNGDQEILAIQDINLRTNAIGQSSPGRIDMLALNDLNFLPVTSGTVLVGGGSLSLAAQRNLNANLSGGDLNIGASNGGIVLRGDNQIDINTPGGRTRLNTSTGNVSLVGGIALDGSILQADARGASIQATANTVFASGSTLTTFGPEGIQAHSTTDLDLTNLALSANPAGNITLSADRNLKVGSVSLNTAANASFTGANISIQSMQNITGGNYTITTPGNLTEEVAATNPAPLVGLDITASRAFNLNNTANNVSFSIPETIDPANLHVLVTAGNDTVLNASASFRNFGNADVQPNSIQNQTGDIYVDGVLYSRGLPPVPPPPPASPEVPATAPEAQQQNNALTPEQRSQILVQSNLALGNLGGFSRVLSETEREHLTARQDALHQTWNLDPFSPTMALVLPGGRPLVYPRELANLQAMLLGLSEDETEEKIRASYNTIVDQELREIWEVRYWRHLLENFIIWEDRE